MIIFKIKKVNLKNEMCSVVQRVDLTQLLSHDKNNNCSDNVPLTLLMMLNIELVAVFL